MKVYFDNSPLVSGHKGRGIGVYTKSLLKYIKKFDDISIVQKYSKDIDLIHYPFFDFFFHTLPIKKKKKTIVTIHDVIPLVYKKEYWPGFRGWFRLQLQKLSLRSVSAIITDSQNSKNDIHKYLGIGKNKIFVTPLAVSEDFSNNKKYIKSSKKVHHNPFILYVGDINYNKNIPALIKAFSKIQHKKIDLIIVSRALKNNHIKESREIYQAIQAHGVKNRVIILTNTDTKELLNYYQQAEWYIQPSLYEGFGLPVLESFFMNTPVICAKTSSLTEVAGDGVIYFDPIKITSITKAIDKALSMNKAEVRNLLKKNKKQLDKFSWDQTATLTRAVYKKVVNS